MFQSYEEPRSAPISDEEPWRAAEEPRSALNILGRATIDIYIYIYIYIWELLVTSRAPQQPLGLLGSS